MPVHSRRVTASTVSFASVRNTKAHSLCCGSFSQKVMRLFGSPVTQTAKSMKRRNPFMAKTKVISVANQKGGVGYGKL